MTYSNIGKVYESWGKHEEALASLRKCLAISMVVRHPISIVGRPDAIAVVRPRDLCGGAPLAVPDVPTLFSRMAFHLETLGRYPEALELFDKSLAIFGPDNENATDVRAGMAVVCYRLGKFDEALALHTTNLAIYTTVPGGAQAEGNTYHNMAVIYCAQSKYEKALELYHKFLEIETKVLGGGDHPHVAGGYSNIADVYTKQGRRAEALEVYNKSLAIMVKLYGEDHPVYPKPQPLNPKP